jgi:hypothetical protein
MQIVAETQQEAIEKGQNLLKEATEKRDSWLEKHNLKHLDVVYVNEDDGPAFAFIKKFDMRAFALTVQFQAEPTKALEMLFNLLVLKESDEIFFTSDTYKIQILLHISENSIKKNAKLITF